MKSLKLNTGSEMPAIGFGTARLGKEPQIIAAVTAAIDHGYRLIDTARIYDNEAAVGKAIATSKVPRSELFITTKLWNDDHGNKQTIAACQKSLGLLGLEYVDLFLIHWPATRRRHDSWRAFEQLKGEGLIKNAGVSNYTIDHLIELQDRSTLVPAVNQVEFHPFIYDQQRPLIDYCREQGIVVQAYSPISRLGSEAHPTIEKIANELDKSEQQIVLRWCIQHGVIPLPSSSSIEHAISNLSVFDFSLTPTQMQTLNTISDGERVTWDPAGMGQ